nr:HAD family hydrolase [bacterium]
MRAVFFDLDGTLLPMDADIFARTYMGSISRWAQDLLPRDKTPGIIWSGVEAMMKNNDASRTCEQVFIQHFEKTTGLEWGKACPVFESYYRADFEATLASCKPDARAAQAVELVRQKGMMAVLATNPLFPAVATYRRIGWAGINPAHFTHVTTYEGCPFCKPNPRYFAWLMHHLRLDACDCAMVGNDADEDVRCAKSLGIRTFFLTETPIMRGGNPGAEAEGGFDALIRWLETL